MHPRLDHSTSFRAQIGCEVFPDRVTGGLRCSDSGLLLRGELDAKPSAFVRVRGSDVSRNFSSLLRDRRYVPDESQSNGRGFVTDHGPAGCSDWQPGVRLSHRFSLCDSHHIVRRVSLRLRFLLVSAAQDWQGHVGVVEEEFFFLLRSFEGLVTWTTLSFLAVFVVFINKFIC